MRIGMIGIGMFLVGLTGWVLPAATCEPLGRMALTSDAMHDAEPQVHNGWVVWTKGYDAAAEIYLWDGAATRRLTNNTYGDGRPRVNNGWVTWMGFVGGDWEIFVWDGTTTRQVTDNETDDLYPEIWDGKVVWWRVEGGDGDVFLWDHGTVTQLSTNPYEDEPPVIHDGQVVWCGSDGTDAEIYLWNGSTVQPLTANAVEDVNPRIDHGRVVWQGRNGIYWDIYLWTGSTTLQLTNTEVDELFPAIEGELVVWEEFDGWNYTPYAWDGTDTHCLDYGSDHETLPRVSNGQVVWRGWNMDGYDTMLWDGQTTQILSEVLPDDREQAIHNGWVVWSAPVVDGGYNEIILWRGERQVRITDDPYTGVAGSLDNRQVAWLHEDFNYQYDLYFWNGADNLLIEATGDNTDAMLRDGAIVWRRVTSGPADIYRWDGAAITNLTNTPALDEDEPCFDGSWAAWSASDGADQEIYLWNGSSVVQLTDNAVNDFTPAVDGGQVAWLRDDGTGTYSVLLWNGSTVLTLDDSTTWIGSIPRIHAGQVAWPHQEDGSVQIFFYDGTAVQALTPIGETHFNPRLHQGRVVWEHQVGEALQDIYLWDGQTVNNLTNAPGGNYEPRIDGGQVVWTNDGAVLRWENGQTRQVNAPYQNATYAEVRDGEILWKTVDYGSDDLYLWDPRPCEVRNLKVGKDGPLTWSPLACGSAGYDVIRGNLADLTEGVDEIAAGPVTCIESNSADTTATDPDTTPLPAGTVWFYLVRGAPYGGYGQGTGGKPVVPSAGGCL